ncbi:MAG: hypothetical protein IJW04_01615 [Ruminococcus sp.]|nr:hypothetical protein [Ruminococcus sp.]
MDYTKWSREYMENAKRVKEDIERLNSKLKYAKGDEARNIRSGLVTLRTMYAECIKTCELLALRGGAVSAA